MSPQGSLWEKSRVGGRGQSRRRCDPRSTTGTDQGHQPRGACGLTKTSILGLRAPEPGGDRFVFLEGTGFGLGLQQQQATTGSTGPGPAQGRGLSHTDCIPG